MEALGEEGDGESSFISIMDEGQDMVGGVFRHRGPGPSYLW